MGGYVMEQPIERVINNLAKMSKEIVIDVRKELQELYDVTSPEYKNFAGLCDMASTMCIDRIVPILVMLPDCILRNMHIVHGEQRHSPRISSDKWGIQHTWIEIVLDEKKLYIDPTSSQFKHLYKDIPDFYISRKKPKWYYQDAINPQFRSFTGKLNRKILFHKTINWDGNFVKVSFGIIELFQYEIWGRISDFIHHFIK